MLTVTKSSLKHPPSYTFFPKSQAARNLMPNPMTKTISMATLFWPYLPPLPYPIAFAPVLV
jgi:hypothetical protein